MTDDQLGSPAHAGMDPPGTMNIGTRGRLPRTRGDGPGTMTILASRPMAPPHTRGWTFAKILGEEPA